MNKYNQYFQANKLILASSLGFLISLPIYLKIAHAETNLPILSQMNFIANQPQLTASVTGNIFYRERIALPKGSIIKIQLVDVSLQDAPSITISEQEIITTGQQVPISFKLDYSPTEIKPNHTYAVQARIEVDNQLTFITTEQYQVITKGNPQENLNIMLRKANSSQSSSFIGKWLLEDLGGIGVIDNLQTTMELTEDGKIFGNAGCNNYTGSYKIENNQLKISPLAMTFKMCPPAIMDQESKFLKALGSSGKITLEDSYLFIESENTEQPLKFTRLSSDE